MVLYLVFLCNKKYKYIYEKANYKTLVLNLVKAGKNVNAGTLYTILYDLTPCLALDLHQTG